VNKKLSILYIEDDLETKNIISEILLNFTDKLITAEDGLKALELYKNNSIDLIFTDLEMPKLNGIEFIKQIRKCDYHIPIVVFTAYTDKEHLLPCANLNIQGYLEKPLDYKKLENIFENILLYLKKIDLDSVKIYENIFYNKNNSSILKDDEEIFLNKKQKMLLELLLLNKNRTVSYETIEFAIWENEGDVMSPMALRTLVKGLRKKINKDCIQNISGLGYILNTNI